MRLPCPPTPSAAVLSEEVTGSHPLTNAWFFFAVPGLPPLSPSAAHCEEMENLARRKRKAGCLRLGNAFPENASAFWQS